jgi:hypothetical protein
MTFHVGQLVVCVDDRPHPVSGACPLKLRAIYRIKGIPRVAMCHAFGEVMQGVLVEGVKAPNTTGDFASARFRPLIDQPDDAEIIVRIKRCKVRIPSTAPTSGEEGSVLGDRPHKI